MILAEGGDKAGQRGDYIVRGCMSGYPRVFDQITGASVAVRTLRSTACVQPRVSLVFCMATQARDVLRNPARMVKIVPLVTLDARSVQRGRRHRISAAKASEAEQSRRCTCRPRDPTFQSVRRRAMAGRAILSVSIAVNHSAARLFMRA